MAGFIRKGQVGDYKNLMKQEQEQRIFQKAREMLEPECLDALKIPRN
jgi:hypothetical protein